VVCGRDIRRIGAGEHRQSKGFLVVVERMESWRRRGAELDLSMGVPRWRNRSAVGRYISDSPNGIAEDRRSSDKGGRHFLG